MIDKPLVNAFEAQVRPRVLPQPQVVVLPGCTGQPLGPGSTMRARCKGPANAFSPHKRLQFREALIDVALPLAELPEPLVNPVETMNPGERQQRANRADAIANIIE